MLRSMTIDRTTANGKYAELLDVAEHLGKGDCGSATNAIAVMAKQSPLFREALTQLQQDNSTTEPITAQR